MMRFISTAGRAASSAAAPGVGLAQAVLRGLAEDGGLYFPASLPTLAPAAFAPDAEPTSLAKTACRLLDPFLTEIPRAARHRLIADAFDFPIPLVSLGDGIHLLELFHGPTLAFKDVGARMLARLMGTLLEPGSGRGSEPATVLVATSGDTGSAVAQAFAGVPGTRVAVLYPGGRISPLQEKQMATLGGNVLALEVEGSFDDCQRLVKQAFLDTDLAARFRLTSANSINIGRLLPQMVYYAHAHGLLPAAERPASFAVPSGNFGNLTAGLMAARLGLPTAGFIAATNANDVVPAYFATGTLATRPSQRTMSNAMDVGDPSNLTRMLSLYDHDLEALKQDVTAVAFDDAATTDTIRQVYEQTGYVLDPHTAVGYLGLRATVGHGVVLATAHPIKFREQVEPIVGHSLPVPDRLARCLERPSRSRPLVPTLDGLRAALTDWPQTGDSRQRTANTSSPDPGDRPR